MRVLLIDNHDSFTYNVAHDIASVVGVLPEVVRNDEPLVPLEDVDSWLTGYDAIVVSPGPGTPHRSADLGISRAAVDQGDVPVLGICLGMQAIGHAAGVPVVRAPRPVHGEVALIEHDGTGLFAGLPQPLPMVRYHSLVLDAESCRASAGLVVDAWCEGVVMAVHHRTRPQWGVQTHPESICSEQGRDLLARFFDEAAAWNASHGRVVSPEAAGVVDLHTPRGAIESPRRPLPQAWTVLARRVRIEASPEAVFDSIFRGQGHAWWLDSAAGEGVSMCGSAAGPLARVAVAVPGGTRLRDASGSHESAIDLLDLVESTLGTVSVVNVDGGPHTPFIPDGVPFTPGWVGYLGYEYACRDLLVGVDSAAHDSCDGVYVDDESPGAALVFSDRVVVCDGDKAWVLALTDAEAPTEVDAAQRAWMDEVASRLMGLSDELPPLPEPPVVGEVSLRHDREAYLRLIEQCHEQIAAGESYELCLTNRIEVATRANSWGLYRRLRALSPRPFAAYLAFDGGHVLSASPERFLAVDAAGRVEAKPIKGTRPRGATAAEDARLAAELVESVKERAENLMIVDLLRHDLSGVCAPGSVHVPLLFDVETHAGVHQLVSTVRGTLAPGVGPLAAVRAALPGGSMTGAPKERSVQILRELEAGQRGVYSGVVGYLSVNGVVDLSIVIRTVVHHEDHLTYGVGGAITARSTADEEWAETLVKARTLGSALGVDLDELLDGPDGPDGAAGAGSVPR